MALIIDGSMFHTRVPGKYAASDAARAGVRTLGAAGSGADGVCWAVPEGYCEGVYSEVIFMHRWFCSEVIK